MTKYECFKAEGKARSNPPFNTRCPPGQMSDNLHLTLLVWALVMTWCGRCNLPYLSFLVSSRWIHVAHVYTVSHDYESWRILRP